MASKTTDTANKTLAKWFGQTDFTPPATWYVGLLTASDVELSGDGYARVAVTNNTTNFPAPTAKEVICQAAVVFPPATADWVEAAKVGLYTASSGGTLRFLEILKDALGDPAPITVLDGQEFSFPVGNLIFTEL